MLFAKNFSENSNLDGLGFSLPVFPSGTNLNLHNIFITPKTVKKVITSLDSSKASGLDCNNNKPEATWAVAIDTSKAFSRVWHAGFPHKLRSYGISGQIFGLIRSLYKNIHFVFLKGPFLVLHFSYCILMTFDSWCCL